MPGDYDQLRELMARHGLLSLFTKHSLRERVSRIVSGLRAEKGSGEYKYARLQLVRLSAPLSAVVIPVLGVLLLSLWAKAVPPRDPIMVNEMIETTEVDPLDEELDLEVDPIVPPKPIEFDELPEYVLEADEPDVNNAPAPEPAHELVDVVTAAPIRSPVVLPGVYQNRSRGQREAAMREYMAPGIAEGAVMRALRWLQSEQLPDGSWPKTKPAMTSLALLTFLAHGDTPKSEEFGETVQKAMQWLVRNQEPNGLFKGRDGHNYSHPIATYALCEAFALTKVPKVKEAAEKALAVVIEGQHPSGGWDYNCKQSTRDDTSYMGWCVQALKAAKMGGFKHPGLDRAMRLAVKGMQKNAHPQGGFGYTTPGRGGLTGVGVLCMQLLGAGGESEARRGLQYLDQQATLNWREPWGASPVYYWYYTTQAKFHAGGAAWAKWNPHFARELVRAQTVLKGESADGKDMGYWDSPGAKEHSDGRVQDTCLSTLQLEVYYRYLPTFKTPRAIEEPDRISTGPAEVPVRVIM
jgi:hypothetical protein